MKTSARRSLLAAIALSPWAAPAQDYRSFDGSGNNLGDPSLGQAGETLGRLAPAHYFDGLSTLDPSLPNPRAISNAIFDQSISQPDQRGMSEWVWVWGQFLDHDIDHTLAGPAAGTLQIPIPLDDPTFGSLPPGSSINLSRSLTVPGTGITTPREHANNISAWIDGSMIYGGRAVEGPTGVDRTSWLRDTSDPAKLRVTPNATFGDLLPMYQHGTSPVMANTAMPGMTSSGGTEGDLAFVAGDVRANENTSLLATHTLFVREHNRLVDVMRAADPLLSDQQLYDRARKIVGAQVQAITYNEFLPAMGVDIGSYSGYNPFADPTILTEFSTAAFRVAHSQINATQLRLDASGNVIPQGHLPLVEGFFNPQTLLDGGLEPLFRGLTQQTQEANDTQMVDALRNQLFSMFIPGFGIVDNATDLAAVDILRSRDMGLPSYNTIRTALGLGPVADFTSITSDATLAAAMASLYADVNDVDLWVGLLAEDHAINASLGETTIAIYQLQFGALRDADRFWFQNDLGGVNSDLLMIADWNGSTPQEAADWLQTLTLSDVISANTDATGLPENVFFAAPVPEPGSLLLVALGSTWFSLRRRR